jgi:hypothetical protein
MRRPPQPCTSIPAVDFDIPSHPGALADILYIKSFCDVSIKACYVRADSPLYALLNETISCLYVLESHHMKGPPCRLSFATAAARMKATCRVVAPDMRGHGCTRTSNDGDLSAEVSALSYYCLREPCTLTVTSYRPANQSTQKQISCIVVLLKIAYPCCWFRAFGCKFFAKSCTCLILRCVYILSFSCQRTYT